MLHCVCKVRDMIVKNALKIVSTHPEMRVKNKWWRIILLRPCVSLFWVWNAQVNCKWNFLSQFSEFTMSLLMDNDTKYFISLYTFSNRIDVKIFSFLLCVGFKLINRIRMREGIKQCVYNLMKLNGEKFSKKS